jgi:hypothetical protein
MLHKFDEGTAKVGRVDEGDASPSSADPRVLIYKPCSLRHEVGKRGLDIEDRVSHVMQALAVSFQETSDGGIGRKRSQELDVRSSEGDHRLFHSLLGDHLPVDRFDAISVEVTVDRGIQVLNGDADMIEVVELQEMSRLIVRVRRLRSKRCRTSHASSLKPLRRRAGIAAERPRPQP